MTMASPPPQPLFILLTGQMAIEPVVAQHPGWKAGSTLDQSIAPTHLATHASQEFAR